MILEDAPYPVQHAQLVAAKAKLQPGETLHIERARPELGEAPLRDVFPMSQSERSDVMWVYRHEAPAFGTWVTAEPERTGALVYIPFVNREDLLETAYRSVAGRLPIVIIDQAKDPLDPGRYPKASIYRITQSISFSVMSNWAHTYGYTHGVKQLCFMHNDAECIDGAGERAVEIARELPDCGIVFTNYDAFGIYNLETMMKIGVNDETFKWYSSDADFMFRILQNGFRHGYAPVKVLHHVSQTLSSYKKRSEAAYAYAEHHHARAQYLLKWGGVNEHEKFSVPYDGAPFSLAPQRALKYRDPRPCGVTQVAWSTLRAHLQSAPPMPANPRADDVKRRLDEAARRLQTLTNDYISRFCNRCTLNGSAVPEGAARDPFRQQLSVRHAMSGKRPKCMLFNCAFNTRLHSGEAYVWREALPVLPEAAHKSAGRCRFLAEDGCDLRDAHRSPSCHDVACEQVAQHQSHKELKALEEAFADYTAAHEAMAVYASDGDEALPFGLEAQIS